MTRESQVIICRDAHDACLMMSLQEAIASILCGAGPTIMVTLLSEPCCLYRIPTEASLAV